MSTPKSPSNSEIIRAMFESSDLYKKAVEQGLKDVIAAIDKLAGAVTEQSVNIGQQNQQIKLLTKSIEELRDAIREQNSSINGHLAVAQQQAANIEALTNLATVLAGNRS